MDLDQLWLGKMQTELGVLLSNNMRLDLQNQLLLSANSELSKQLESARLRIQAAESDNEILRTQLRSKKK